MSVRPKVIVVALLSLAHAVPASAADEEVQGWAYLVAKANLSDNATATFELSPRVKPGAEQVLTRATVDIGVAPDLKVGGGLAWVEYAGGRELRTIQQASLALGPLSLRSRVEERFFQGADRMQLRLRQGVSTDVPLDEATKLTGGFEYLYIARSQTRGTGAHTDGYRANIGINHDLSPHWQLGVAYLGILTPRSGAPDKYAHVPQLRLTWKQ